MSTMTEHLTPNDMKGIPRKTATIVCDLVNNYGVRMRIQKGGGHLFLYNGDRQDRPYKISGSRPEETTLDFLYKWIEENVPEYGKKEKVTSEDLKMLAEAVSTSEVKAEPKESVAKDALPDGWTEYKFGFITDGTTYRCNHPGCDFSRESKRGIHLHEMNHDGRKSASAAKGGTAASLVRNQKQEMQKQAARVLAEAHGWRVVDKDSPDQRDETIAALRTEIEDLKAKIALIREAMRA